MTKPAWQKSSFCGEGDSCVHVARTWQKSSYCSEGASCVHIAASTETIHLTESSDPTGAILNATLASFTALLITLKEESPRG
ncbi:MULTISPECIES: DUF397 domain-containing protein [unclassified Streptomyces]|uniref:DUF397 domain-containing protein n=1 Tax=unclassified Streptomyces TaxID=2593676 RepID=UPI00236643E3|nr:MULTISPECIES: DUF397 domain-containing protein [unclassified Streptomyces]MDF3141633.1 DUF397 domain-containing protein [Streptomyces sp. T21Q-yed]WDF39342.1 DUF397 domain-containing protein [Streptomyces sp. T12]